MQLVVMLINYQLNDKEDYLLMIRGFEINGINSQYTALNNAV